MLPAVMPDDARAQEHRAAEAPFTQVEISEMPYNFGSWPLGTWPLEFQPDPTNRVSGKPAAIDLGRRLFFDARMSPSGRVACSSCHRPERAWTDGRNVGVGLKPGKRNTPSLLDVGIRGRHGEGRWYGWAGASDSLWMQSIRPLLDPNEMGSNAGHVQRHIAGQADLAGSYEKVFGRAIDTVDGETALVDAAKALAAFQETLVSPRTPFDDFLRALAARDEVAASHFPDAARRGLRWFIGAGRCVECHAAKNAPASGRPTWIVPQGSSTSRDPGRRGDNANLLASPYNLHGRFNDEPARKAHWHPNQLHLKSLPPNGEFRPPTMRNLMHTAPYMHDGSKATLRDVVATHGHPRAPKSDAQQIADLVAFLTTLSAP